MTITQPALDQAAENIRAHLVKAQNPEKIEIPGTYWEASNKLDDIMFAVDANRQRTGDSDDLRRQLDEMTKVINNTIDQLIQQGR